MADDMRAQAFDREPQLLVGVLERPREKPRSEVHHAEAVAEARSSYLGEHEITQPGLPYVAQPLDERIVDQSPFHPREPDIAMNRIADAATGRHGREP
jgi:hypothetical protein